MATDVRPEEVGTATISAPLAGHVLHHQAAALVVRRPG